MNLEMICGRETKVRRSAEEGSGCGRAETQAFSSLARLSSKLFKVLQPHMPYVSKMGLLAVCCFIGGVRCSSRIVEMELAILEVSIELSASL